MTIRTLTLAAAALAPLVAISGATAQNAFKSELPKKFLQEKDPYAIGRTVNPDIVRKTCPDLAVVMDQQPRGATILVVFRVRNVGTADYVSGRNQQSLTVKTPRGDRTFGFGNLAAGHYQTLGTDYYRPFEFPFTYTGRLNFGPDIRTDGNRQNDDCNRSNDQARLTTAR